jgi:hypothetical protein
VSKVQTPDCRPSRSSSSSGPAPSGLPRSGNVLVAAAADVAENALSERQTNMVILALAKAKFHGKMQAMMNKELQDKLQKQLQDNFLSEARAEIQKKLDDNIITQTPEPGLGIEIMFVA